MLRWSSVWVLPYFKNAQPHYVILDAEGNQLGDARGYDLDVAKFVEWMDTNKALFK